MLLRGRDDAGCQAWLADLGSVWLFASARPASPAGGGFWSGPSQSASPFEARCGKMLSWVILPPMASSIFQDIKGSLRKIYREDDRPWLVGFSGGKDSTIL